MLGSESGRSLLTGDVAGMCNRFSKYVDIPKDISKCWKWTGARRTANGYGCFVVGKQREQAHRVAVALSGRNILPSAVVRHTCDNKLCVNPAHLVLGTQADNCRDKAERHRARGVPNNKHSARLTADQVREIRWALKRNATGRELAKTYGVSEALICLISKRKVWADVDP